jgi:hypothetical protein
MSSPLPRFETFHGAIVAVSGEQNETQKKTPAVALRTAERALELIQVRQTSVRQRVDYYMRGRGESHQQNTLDRDPARVPAAATGGRGPAR